MNIRFAGENCSNDVAEYNLMRYEIKLRATDSFVKKRCGDLSGSHVRATGYNRAVNLLDRQTDALMY